MATDFSDPCARAAALRDAYFNLISGANESLIRFKGPNGEQEVRFGQGKVELLKSEWEAAENACAIQNGGTNTHRRYAIRAGARRPRAVDFWTIPTWFFAP
ncbi:hypothetical protein [Bradyrhizobium sp. USDA 4350]